MPDSITVGPIAIPPLVLAAILSLGAGSLFVSLVLRRRFSRSAADWVANRSVFAVFSAIVVWKVWPIFRWTEEILADPLILLRLPGGTAGVWAGIVAALAVLVHGALKKRGHVVPLVMHLSILALAFALSLAVFPVVFGSPGQHAGEDSAALQRELSELEYLTQRSESDRTKPVVLTFWATWCGPCRAELPVKLEFFKQYGDRIDYVAVNMTRSESSREVVHQFVEDNEMLYPVALDRTGRLAALLGVRGTPTTVVVDSDGTVADRWMGPSSLDRLQRGLRRANRAP